MGNWAASGDTFECEHCRRLFATFGEAEAHEATCPARLIKSPDGGTAPVPPVPGSPVSTPERQEAASKQAASLACLRHTCHLTVLLEEKAAPIAVAAQLCPTKDEEPAWLRAVLACSGATERGVALVGLRALIGATSRPMSTVAPVTQQRLLRGPVVVEAAGLLWDLIGEEAGASSPVLYEVNPAPRPEGVWTCWRCGHVVVLILTCCIPTGRPASRPARAALPRALRRFGRNEPLSGPPRGTG